MKKVKTYISMKSVFSDSGIEQDVRLDQFGHCKVSYTNGEDRLLLTNKIPRSSFARILRRFHWANEREKEAGVPGGSVKGFWFFRLYVEGVLVSYESGIVLPETDSTYAGLDDDIAEMVGGDTRVFSI